MTSLAISVSISGDYAIVGARYEDEDASGANQQNNAGSAYIFERDGLGNWTQAQKLTASDRAADDYFGSSVSISGNYAIVGASEEDEDASGANTQPAAGSAYIFERDGLGNWTQAQKLVASDRAGRDYFGPLSLSRATMPSWGLTKRMKMPREPTHNLLPALLISLSETDWATGHKHKSSQPPTGQPMTTLAISVSISGDYAIVGAYREDEDASGANTQTAAGSAYIFERDGLGNWTQAQKLTASDRAADDEFGFSVSISGDYAIVGAHSGRMKMPREPTFKARPALLISLSERPQATGHSTKAHSLRQGNL